MKYLNILSSVICSLIIVFVLASNAQATDFDSQDGGGVTFCN